MTDFSRGFAFNSFLLGVKDLMINEAVFLNGKEQGAAEVRFRYFKTNLQSKPEWEM